LGEEILELEGLVRRLIGADIKLVTEVAPRLWNATVDPGQIQQVVLNMAVNARDAMPNGGEIHLKLRNTTITAAEALRIPDGYPGEFVLLTISDTGSGMPPEVMKKIFEPFYTTKAPGKGTGLGLATCYGIVKQMGGMISVASELRVGTTFSIYLPKGEISTPANVRTFNEDALPRGNETILVVEDEEVLRELASQILESLGYCVLLAEDGESALSILEQTAASRIQLVVTDLVMPRMTGRELATRIIRDFGQMPVLFMSGYTDDQILRNAVEDAEVEFLQKPFTPKGLAHKIREVLDRPAPMRIAVA